MLSVVHAPHLPPGRRDGCRRFLRTITTTLSVGSGRWIVQNLWTLINKIQFPFCSSNILYIFCGGSFVFLGISFPFFEFPSLFFYSWWLLNVIYWWNFLFERRGVFCLFGYKIQACQNGNPSPCLLYSLPNVARTPSAAFCKKIWKHFFTDCFF